MGSIRKNYSASLKPKMAFEAVKKEKTISQLSSEYGVHANQIKCRRINSTKICYKSAK